LLNPVKKGIISLYDFKQPESVWLITETEVNA